MDNLINPLWLRSFVAVSELGSFTRAAEALDLTQVAVSQHLKKLEAELGPLLIRRPRQLELTPSGNTLLAYARDIDIASQRLRNQLASNDPFQGEISLASPGSLGLALYPRLLDLQVQHPGLTVRYRSAPTRDIVSAVLENRCEVGIVSQAPDDSRLTAQPFAKEALCLVLPASVANEDWPTLCQLGFIDHPDGQDMLTRLVARRYPGQRLEQLPRRGFTNQIGMILEPVARGLGFTVLPRFAVDAFTRPGELRVVAGGPQVIDMLWLIHRAEWPLSAAAAWVMAALGEALASADPK